MARRSGVVIVALLGFAVGLFTAPKPTTPGQLPIPAHVSTTTLSGPLILPSSSRSVLGAQTIDPLDFIAEINAARETIGVPALRINTTLMRAAKLRVAVIKKHQNFSHQDPFEGIELGTVLPKVHYSFSYATENIGMGGLSAKNFVDGFLNSPSHKQNLLNPTLTETGAAIDDGPYQQYYVNYAVQLFAIPAGTDEYLGYKQGDIDLYEAQLSAVTSQLNPIVRLVTWYKYSKTYKPSRYTNLKRQQQILIRLLTTMKQSQPFTNSDVALLYEFNSLL